jgi:hypothetical protein
VESGPRLDIVILLVPTTVIEMRVWGAANDLLTERLIDL